MGTSCQWSRTSFIMASACEQNNAMRLREKHHKISQELGNMKINKPRTEITTIDQIKISNLTFSLIYGQL